jgi:TetR/AcrR family transcriptional repressor of multidrug resistance operon
MLTDPDNHDKRTIILRATLHLLATCGFHGFSMKQLADHAGVATGTLYLYFRDREDIIRQLHQEIIQTFAQHVLAEHDYEQSLLKQYKSICWRFWQFCRDNPDILLGKGQFDHLPPEILRDHHRDAKKAFLPMAQLFQQCRENGLIKPLCDEILATLTVEPFIHLARKHHLKLVTLGDQEVEAIIDAAWDAIALPPGKAK